MVLLCYHEERYMTIGSNKESSILFFGDILSFALASWLALALRSGAVPSLGVIQSHIAPLTLLSFLWIITFFVIGLYDKRTLASEEKILSTILRAQAINSAIAVIFFYLFTPYLGIAPKTVLALVIGISTALIIVWRLLEPTIVVKSARTEPALLIGSGKEMEELKEEVNARAHYAIHFVSSIDLDRAHDVDLQREVEHIVARERISSIVVYLRHEKAEKLLPTLYKFIFSGVQFYDMHKVYEEVFERIPLSIVRHGWFLENISPSAHAGYDALKRGMDVVLASLLGIASLVLYPFVILAIKLEDGGEIFSFQKRVGQNNKIINVAKFRTMDIANDDAAWSKGENKVTRVGAFLRKMRIDELPQLWNVITGDVSLIGPRPEFERAVKEYSEHVPYYNMRHIIKPGLSGWAQLYHERHPHHGVDIEETRNKLSYDLFYVKNRSFTLDVIIALKTIKLLLSRKGV